MRQHQSTARVQFVHHERPTIAPHAPLHGTFSTVAPSDALLNSNIADISERHKLDIRTLDKHVNEHLQRPYDRRQQVTGH